MEAVSANISVLHVHAQDLALSRVEVTKLTDEVKQLRREKAEEAHQLMVRSCDF